MISEEEFKHLTPDQRQQINEQINARMGDYLTSRCGISNLNKNFRCPVCGHDGGSYHINDSGKPVLHCFSGKGCNGESYDLIDLIGKLRGISGYNDKLFTAINELGISIPAAPGTGYGQQTQGTPARSDQGAAAQQPAQDPQQRKAPNPEGVKNFVRQAAAAMSCSPAEDYMIDRGFEPDFLKEMRIGYDEYNKAVVIPYNKQPDNFFDYYVMRYIEPKTDAAGKQHRFYKPSSIQEPIFHSDNLTNGMPYVFVTEGQIDALSVEQAGGNAIAIGSTNNGGKLLNYLKTLEQIDPEYKSKVTLIISFDNDTAGKAAEKELVKKLTDAGYVTISANDAGLYDPTPALTEFEAERMKPVKDINDLLIGDPDILTRRIERMISKPADVYRDSFSMESFRSKYQEQRIKNSKQPRISTGFNKLDEALSGGIRPALIFLGAITSIGKTTFVMQIADYIAQQGKDVLIFALEMSRFELVSRSISRESLRIARAQQTPQPNNALAFYEISDGLPLPAAKAAILKQAEDYYFSSIAPHIFIVEGEGDITTDQIRDKVQAHAALTGAAPVVIVDYLQLLQPPNVKDAGRWSDKQIVDHNTVAMKHISRDFSTPVIGVISLNRAAYNEDVNLASGKESGAIEYGCDILLGMNQKKENTDETKEIYIDILKHRGGKKDRRINFLYTPAHSSFKDQSVERISKKKDSGSGSTATQQPQRKGEQDADGFVTG